MIVLNSVVIRDGIPWKQTLLTSEYSDMSHIGDDTIGLIPWKRTFLTSEYSDMSHIGDDTRGRIPWKATLPPYPWMFWHCSRSARPHHHQGVITLQTTTSVFFESRKALLPRNISDTLVTLSILAKSVILPWCCSGRQELGLAQVKELFTFLV